MSGQQRSTNIGVFEVIVCLLSLLQSYAAKRISTKWEGVPFKNVALAECICCQLFILTHAGVYFL